MKNIPKDYYAIIYFILILYAIQVFNTFLPLEKFGIFPRSVIGIPGIAFSPLLHANFSHLASNTLPLIVLFSMLVYTYPKEVVSKAILAIIILGGSMVWLFARKSYHIGASGLIYGLIVFLVYSGIRNRNTKATTIAIITLFLYGGLIWGVLPILSGHHVSWEGHLFGAIAGGITAHFLITKN